MDRRFAAWARDALVMCVAAYALIMLQHNLVKSQTTPIWCTPLSDCQGSGGKVGLNDWLNAKVYTEQWELIRSTVYPVTTTPITLTQATGTNAVYRSDNATAKTINMFPGTTGSTVLFIDAGPSVITIVGNGTGIRQDGITKTQIVSSGTEGDFCAFIADSPQLWRVVGCKGFS